MVWCARNTVLCCWVLFLFSFFVVVVCVCVVVFVGGGGGGWGGGGLLLRFYVYIFVGLIKHSELTLAGEIGCYRNDHYYYNTLTPEEHTLLYWLQYVPSSLWSGSGHLKELPVSWSRNHSTDTSVRP